MEQFNRQVLVAVLVIVWYKGIGIQISPQTIINQQ